METINSMKYRQMIKQKYEQARIQSDNVEMERLGKYEDMVNHPPHYNKNGIETIDAIQAATDDGFEYYLQGNILKYLWRYRYKNGSEDLEKAQWYLNKLITITKEREEDDHVNIK